MLLILIISLFNPNAKERIIDYSLDQMNLNNDNKNIKDIYIFSDQHTHHYISAYRMYVDNKFLGVGIKNFRKFCDDKKYEVSELSCSTHPHNTYIQILSETGIIGFLFLIFVFFYFVKYVIRHMLLKFKGNYYFEDFEICILSGILLYLWPLVPTGNIFNNWLNIISIIYLPFLIWSRKSHKTSN